MLQHKNFLGLNWKYLRNPFWCSSPRTHIGICQFLLELLAAFNARENMRCSSLKLLEVMEVATRHKRSNSDSMLRKVQKDKLSNILEAAHHLKSDMGELKMCVKAKKRQSSSSEVPNSFKPEPAKDLIKEIAVLEMEVVHMEKYLLSLYRKAFDGRVSLFSALDETSESTSATHKRMFSEVSEHELSTMDDELVINSNGLLLRQDLTCNPPVESCVDSSIQRGYSSLSRCSASSLRTTPMRGLAEAEHSYQSLPLCMLERVEIDTSNATSWAEHLSATVPDHILKNPNRLSEEMIKCISAIYGELAEPPLINHGFPSPPIAFSSSISDSSPNHQYDIWSPERRKKPSCQSWMGNPFMIDGSKELSGSYSTMVEVQWISRDSQSIIRVKDMLQNFRSLVSRLEEVNPKNMKHEEKLAFWINLHNALVMHAFMDCGIPHKNLKRISLILKAAYNVGGHTINVDMIQNSILGCRLPRPGQWLQSLFFPKAKLSAGDERKAYAIEHPEPRLYFALCSGSHSDPAVRVYTPKGVFQELEAAKEDYFHTTLRIHREQKILLPKIVHTFAKDSGLCPAGFMEMTEHSMPEFLRKSFQQHQPGKFWKRIEWIPHNFKFRYLFSKELSK